MDDVFARVLQHMISQTVNEKAQNLKAKRAARHARNQADPEFRARDNARRKAQRDAAKGGESKLARGSYKVKGK